MHHYVFAALAACAACPSALAQTAAAAPDAPAGWAPYLEVRLWEAHDGVPIKQFDKDWSQGFSPRAGRNVMFQRNRVEAGVERGPWRLAWEYRQEAVLSTNRDTLELVHLYKQRIRPAAPAAFDVHASMDGWAAQGLRASRWFALPGQAAGGPRLNLALALYARPRLRENSVDGTAAGGGGDDYSFSAVQNDVNSRFRYPFMGQSPGGSGVSTALTLDWPLGQASRFTLNVDDLWSRMRWTNLPQTRQTADSAVASYDAQGYINYRPLLNGRNSQISKSTALRRTAAATLAGGFGDWGAALQIERYAGVTIPTFTGSRRFAWGTLSASVDTRFKTFGVGVERGDFHVALQADTLNPNRAKALGLNLGYRHPF
ncbi:hypothetical protein [Janthinobacterium fluminis]|uniref:Uncharacterized protein n=1 Tax=Janthinobacterium fluminis TaxID=2987524 RepID=A0ABT5JYI8_9BURK|nr:hypothetical protein [Janthinobacterium fluminis]MDC8757649.1 hypothetical protein [Janthinobacterium fluminis]